MYFWEILVVQYFLTALGYHPSPDQTSFNPDDGGELSRRRGRDSAALRQIPRGEGGGKELLPRFSSWRFSSNFFMWLRLEGAGCRGGIGGAEQSGAEESTGQIGRAHV